MTILSCLKGTIYLLCPCLKNERELLDSLHTDVDAGSEAELLDPLLMGIDTGNEADEDEEDALFMGVDIGSEPDEDEEDALEEASYDTPAPSASTPDPSISPIARIMENNRRREDSLVVDKISKKFRHYTQ